MTSDLAAVLGPTRLLIGGTWRDASDGGEFPVLDPATGAELARVADGTVQDAVDAVRAAEQAQAGWAATLPRRRSEVLRRVFEMMTERTEEIARLITAENGKVLSDARAEVRYAADFFRWYAEEAVRIDGTVRRAPEGDYRIMTLQVPVGVVALVTPWNFPAAMLARKVGPALAAGCAAVVKPASETPLTALLLADILQQAGVPGGVVNVVTSRRSGEVVRAMLEQRAVRKVSFTGSTEVGRVLLHQAADRVLASSMELGGNAPFIVLADADLDAAVAGAMVAKMRGGGQACTAANRFYVHEAVADEFSERLCRAMAELRVGPGLDPTTDVGPMISERARSGVEDLLSTAVSAGAKVRLGGSRLDRHGFFFAPTVLDRVAPEAQIVNTEIFGPVAPIVRFDDEADAVRWANDSEFGLSSYVFSRDLSCALRIAEALEVGMVGVNRGLVSDAAAPFGGVKQSGLGREGGAEGLAEYTETKYIAVSW